MIDEGEAVENGNQVPIWISSGTAILQLGFGVFLWYFVTKYIPGRDMQHDAALEAERRRSVEAQNNFLEELREQRRQQKEQQDAYMKSLTAVREDAFKMRQEDRAETAKFFQMLMAELLPRRELHDAPQRT